MTPGTDTVEPPAQGRDLLDDIWGAQPRRPPRDVLDDIWGERPRSPNAAKAEHLARIRPAMEAVEAAKADQEGAPMTAARSFAEGVTGTVGKFASGLSQITRGVVPSAALGEQLQGAAARVAPTDENVGRYPLTSAANAAAGEAAPQFLLGEAAGALARPLVSGVSRVVPFLKAARGPALPAGSAVREAAKAVGRNIVPQAAAQAAAFAPLDPDHPVSKIGLAMSLIPTLSEAGAAAAGPKATSAMEELFNARRDVMARAGREENVAQMAGGEPPVGPTVRRGGQDAYTRLRETGHVEGPLGEPASAGRDLDSPNPTSTRRTTPIDESKLARPMAESRGIETADTRKTTDLLDEIWGHSAEQPGEPLPGTGEAYPEGVSTASSATTRRTTPVDESKLARPMPDDAPITTATTRAKQDLLDRIWAESEVRPGEAKPAAHQAYPEGASFAETSTRRRPAPTPDAVSKETAAPAALKTFADEPPKAMPRSEPVTQSFGRDDLATAPAPPVPTRVSASNTARAIFGGNEAQSFGSDRLDAPSRIPVISIPRLRPVQGESGPAVPETPEDMVNRISKQLFPQSAARAADAPRPQGPGIPRFQALPFPKGEPKNVAAEDLLNTSKLGLKTPAQEATVAADLDRLKAAGVDREGVSIDRQAQQARYNIENRLKFLLTDYDPAAARKMSGAEIGRLYEELSNNVAQRTALMERIADPSTTEAEHAEWDRAIDALQSHADAMTKNIITGTAEAGRSLNYLRQVAAQSNDASVWLVQAQRALGDRPLTDEMSSGIVRLAQMAREACG